MSWQAAEPASRFRNPDGHREPIAPGVMHYSYWSPDGRRAIVVARSKGGLTLTLLTPPSRPGGEPAGEAPDAAGDWSVRGLIDGAPMFSAWSPDGTTLAAHAGQQLVLFDAGGEGGGRRVLTDQPRFRAPAWSPDGARALLRRAGQRRPRPALALAPRLRRARGRDGGRRAHGGARLAGRRRPGAAHPQRDRARRPAPARDRPRRPEAAHGGARAGPGRILVARRDAPVLRHARRRRPGVEPDALRRRRRPAAGPGALPPQPRLLHLLSPSSISTPSRTR